VIGILTEDNIISTIADCQPRWITTDGRRGYLRLTGNPSECAGIVLQDVLRSSVANYRDHGFKPMDQLDLSSNPLDCSRPALRLRRWATLWPACSPFLLHAIPAERRSLDTAPSSSSVSFYSESSVETHYTSPTIHTPEPRSRIQNRPPRKIVRSTGQARRRVLAMTLRYWSAVITYVWWATSAGPRKITMRVIPT